ncbi:MAG: signal recognition particle-docking protein FtsY, partial [Thaumarchaeota archaeon]
QAKNFDEYVGIDYVILAKLDADARGGSAISISYQTNKPILFVGTGQDLEELKPFTKDLIKSILTSS